MSAVAWAVGAVGVAHLGWQLCGWARAAVARVRECSARVTRDCSPPLTATAVAVTVSVGGR